MSTDNSISEAGPADRDPTTTTTFAFTVESGEGRIVWRCVMEDENEIIATSDLPWTFRKTFTCTVPGRVASIRRDRKHPDDTFSGTLQDRTERDYVDWRTLSKSADHRVITTPRGSTITAADISSIDLEDQCVVILLPGDRRYVVREDVRDFFAVATEAHRRFGGISR